LPDSGRYRRCTHHACRKETPAAGAQNTDASLQIAKAEAQLSEAAVLGGESPDTSGTLLNTYA
jgi:hypothetical protein